MLNKYDNKGNFFFVEVIPNIDNKGQWDGQYELAIQARRQNINDESFVLFSFIDDNRNLLYDCGELASNQIKTSASEDNLSIEMFRENCDQNIIAQLF